MNAPEVKDPTRLDAINLLKMLSKWRKQLIYIFIISMVVSYLCTLLITPLFKSTTTVYPFNLDNYSKESSTEQMVQLFKSEDVREELIKAFDLYTHYDIDTAGKSPRHEMMLLLDENISVTKTEYESVEISILDKDPKVAARMCDSILVYMDRKALSLVREKSAEELTVINKRLEEKTAEMDSMLARQLELSTKYGVMDYENQVLGFAREYYRSMGSGGVSSKMEQAKVNLEEKGNEAFSLKENLWRVRGQYNDLKKESEELKADLFADISYHNLITKAVPAEKKDSPKRMLLALLVTLSVMAVSLLVIIYQEFYKEQFDQKA